MNFPAEIYIRIEVTQLPGGTVSSEAKGQLDPLFLVREADIDLLADLCKCRGQGPIPGQDLGSLSFKRSLGDSDAQPEFSLLYSKCHLRINAFTPLKAY